MISWCVYVKQGRVTHSESVSVYNASEGMRSFLAVVTCYLAVLLPVDLDSNISSFAISTR